MIAKEACSRLRSSTNIASDRKTVQRRGVGGHRIRRGIIMRFLTLVAATAVVGCVNTPSSSIGSIEASRQTAGIGPIVDHHQHILSRSAADFLNESEGSGTPIKVEVPSGVEKLLAQRAAHWNNAAVLMEAYTEDAIVLEERPIQGQRAAAGYVSDRFGSPYDLTPIAYSGEETTATVVALYTRGKGTEAKSVGTTLLVLKRVRSGEWRIAVETMKFPAPTRLSPLDASDLVELLDQADIRRAVILSVAYLFESPLVPADRRSAAKLRSENDWTAAEAARYPDRLVGFCSVNPLAEQALTEMQRCKQQLGLRGLKLHFGNSNVDLERPGHLVRIREVFAFANLLQMPIVAHLWSGHKDYGRRDAELFLEQVLPHAPDVVVQVAHMAGGGPGWTDEALEVLAKAVEAGDPRTRNLYFDIATVADLQTPEQLGLLAMRIRQIGPERILYGSDGSFGGRNTPNEEWGTFRGMVPLTDEEFSIVQGNVAPYLR